MTKAIDDTVSTDPRAHAEAAGYQSGKIPIEPPSFNPVAIIQEEYERLAVPETRARCPFEKALEALKDTIKPFETGEIAAPVLESEIRLWARAFVHGLNTETYRRLTKESINRAAHEHRSAVYAIHDRLNGLEANCIVDAFHCVLRKSPDGKGELPQDFIDLLGSLIAGAK